MIWLRREEHVGWLHLARDPCNEIGLREVEALEAICDALEADPPRALVLCSDQARGFSAGADLRALQEELGRIGPLARALRMAAFLRRIHRVMTRLDTLPFPTIAVIHRVCFGGGLELALTADLRIAEKGARFAFPELRLGLIPGFGGLPRLERETGIGLCRDLLLSGRSLNAKRALEVGLVQQVLPAGEGRAAAGRLAAQIARQDPEATRSAKRFLKRVPRIALLREQLVFLRLAQRAALDEALDDFVGRKDAMPWLPRQKRKP